MWDRTENQIKLVFIRHGATNANKEHRYLGKTDENLSVEGIKELQQAKCGGRYRELDYLFSSPMKRCLETAGILYPAKKLEIISEWEEMDFGIFEGKNYIDLQDDERYQAWIDSKGTLPFPEGESREAFIQRCERGFNKVLIQLSEWISAFTDERQKQMITVGMIVHGGTIMSLLSSFYGGEYFDYQVANGRGYVCKLEYRKEKIRLTALEKQ